MEQKFVKVEILIDTTNQEQLNCLIALFGVLGGVKDPTSITITREKTEKTESPVPSKPAETKKRSSKPATTDFIHTPEPSPEKTKSEPSAETSLEKKEYKIEEVREKLKEKVSDHREAIKSKLTELGAPNVSSLDPDNYPAFMDFLNSLE